MSLKAFEGLGFRGLWFRALGFRALLTLVLSYIEPSNPRGSIHTTIRELGPQNHNGDGLFGPNSMIVVYTLTPGRIQKVDPLRGVPIKYP